MPIPGFEGGIAADPEIRPTPSAPETTKTTADGRVIPILPRQAVSDVAVAADFGRLANDYIEYYVYDNDGNFIGSENKEGGISQEVVTLNPGIDIRELGLIAGKYRIVYNFVRQRGGQQRVFFLDSEGIVWNGEVREEDGQYFKGIELDPNNGTTKEEVTVADDDYLIHEISPSRQEIRIIPKSYDVSEYKNGFSSLGYEDFEYNPLVTDTTGDIAVDSNDATLLVATLAEADDGFNDGMIGGEIVIKNAFITGYQENITYKQVPNPAYVASQPPDEAPPKNKIVEAKEIAKEEALAKKSEINTGKYMPGELDGEDAVTQTISETITEEDTTGTDPVTDSGDGEWWEGDMGGDV